MSFANTSDSSSRWFRGNLHTHTVNSDGDSSPTDVARWYRDAGYHFLVFTDHNSRTEVDKLQTELDREYGTLGMPSLELIPGEEVTDAFEGRDRHYPIHVNAIGSAAVVGPQGGRSKSDVLRRCIEAIHRQDGLAIVNHPNFHWSLTTADMLPLSVPFHLEIHNAHPEVNNLGSLEVPGAEQVWDDLLTQGLRVFSVATDDAHVFRRFHQTLPNPGRAWVACRASSNARDEILTALRTGHFYCSTGVELADVTVDGSAFAVNVQPRYDCRYIVTFIGAGGRALQQTETVEARYELGPNEVYVRATVQSSQGERAWTQPVFRHSSGGGVPSARRI